MLTDFQTGPGAGPAGHWPTRKGTVPSPRDVMGNFRSGWAVGLGMRRSFPFLFVAVAGFGGVVAIAAPARAQESADRCVSIQTATVTNGLAMDVQNSCSKRLACALTWTLTCENASGKATSKAKQEARFAIDASDTHHTTGSAATCKDGWKIDDVSWDCAAAEK